MDTWDPQANEIFIKALAIASAVERAAFLDRACANNAQLRAKVDSFLSAYERAGAFLEAPFCWRLNLQQFKNGN